MISINSSSSFNPGGVPWSGNGAARVGGLNQMGQMTNMMSSMNREMEMMMAMLMMELTQLMTGQSTGSTDGGGGSGAPIQSNYSDPAPGSAGGSSSSSASGNQAAPTGTSGSDLPATFNSPIKGADKAINWAKQQIGTNQYQDMCAGFSKAAFAKTGSKVSGNMNGATAAADAASFQHSGKMHAYNPKSPPPPGAIVFWGANRDNQEDGHACISTGGGKVISSGWPGQPVAEWSISKLVGMESGQQPVGWADPNA